MKILLTGASSGIGKSMALYLDSLGHELILVSRDKKKLAEVSKELKNEALILSYDLQKENEVYHLYEYIKNNKIKIDVLINNAGFGLFGLFHKTNLKIELDMIDLNIKAYHILTKLFLQDFIKKDKGYILNVCSSAGFMAGPRLSTYYATKNYITKLTMAINEELRMINSKVYVGALCPGPVNTNFNKVAHGDFVINGADPDYVAKYAIEKMFKKKMIIVPKLSIKLALFFIRFMPYRLQLFINYHIQYRKERK